MNSRDETVLRSLYEAHRRHAAGRGPEFVRPRDVGCRDLEFAALQRLVRDALALCRPRDVPLRLSRTARAEAERMLGGAPPATLPSGVREYAITEAGLVAIDGATDRYANLQPEP